MNPLVFGYVFFLVFAGLEISKEMGNDAHLGVLGIAILTILICLFLWKREASKEES